MCFLAQGVLEREISSLRLQGAGFSLQRWHQLWGERGSLVAPASWSIWSNSSYPTSALRFRSRARFTSRLLSPLNFLFIFFSGLNISSVSDREKMLVHRQNSDALAMITSQETFYSKFTLQTQTKNITNLMHPRRSFNSWAILFYLVYNCGVIF